MDSVDYSFDFGDATPPVLTSTPVYPGYLNLSNYSSAFINHTYSNPGAYTVTVIARFPNNVTDTAVWVNGITLTTTCNNLTGTVFRDNNSNCVYDVGDIPVACTLKVWVNDYDASQYMGTNMVSGQYTGSVLQGINYKIQPEIWQTMSYIVPPLSCGLTDSFPFTASATNTIDFPIKDTTAFFNHYVDDSAAVTCFNTNNGVAFIRGATVYYTDVASPVFQVQVFFGDGHDTIAPAYAYNTPPFFPITYGFYHQYQSAGTYSVMAIITELTSGITDTVFSQNLVELSDSCGSVSGHIFDDLDLSCTFNTGEEISYIASVSVYQNNVFLTADFTDANGFYSLDLPPGTYDLDVSNLVYNLGYSMSCAQSFTTTITIPPSTNLTQDFAVVCNQTSVDFSTGITAWSFRPGTIRSLYTSVLVASCNAASGTATLILDPLVSFVSSCDSSFTPTINGNVLTWPLTTTQTFNWNSFWDCFLLLTDSSAQIGDSLCFTFYFTPNVPDSNPQNDTIHMCYPVINSYDPNIKEVNVPGMFANGDVLNNRTHDYTVHFQNTGNDVAYNIFILDTLDNNLNPATLQILGSSHTMEVDYLQGNVLKFNFNNINLPDSNSNEPLSHGWLRYTIAQDPNLAAGSVIENTAYIYFDINPAIITNTTVNTIVNPTGLPVQTAVNTEVYPVPASEFVQVNLSTPVSGSLTLFNMLGQPVVVLPLNGQTAMVDVRSLPAGVYQLQIQTAHKVVSKPVVIRH